MRRFGYVFFIAVIALFALTFSFKNRQIVEIDYYFGLNFVGQLPLLLLLTFAAGALLGYAVCAFSGLQSRRKWRNRNRAETQKSVTIAY